MLALSRKIGDKFYIQPLIGDIMVVEVLAIFIENSFKMVRLLIRWVKLKKIDQKRTSIKIKHKRFSMLIAAQASLPKEQVLSSMRHVQLSAGNFEDKIIVTETEAKSC